MCLAVLLELSKLLGQHSRVVIYEDWRCVDEVVEEMYAAYVDAVVLYFVRCIGCHERHGVFGVNAE